VQQGFPDDTIQPGNILVSNFNDGANNQGQGTTISVVRQDRTNGLFATVPTPGLTAALGILQAGFVLVGSITVPANDFPAAVGGPITVFDSDGDLVTTIKSPLLDGPWGMAVDDDVTTAKIWVSNVLSGTVIRINVTTTPSFAVKSITTIANGYGHSNTTAQPLVGPSGLAYSHQKHVLYVAVGFDHIFSVAKADTLTSPVSKGTLVYSDSVHLHGPLGLVLAPNGDLINAQNDGFNANTALFPSELVEFTPNAATPTSPSLFVGQFSIDSAGGSAFNIALAPSTDPFAPLGFAYVDDTQGTVVQTFLPTNQSGFGNAPIQLSK
jgi:hypothetical protein